jgi:DNA-directed RNA polymerase specialized sigma24 family protein
MNRELTEEVLLKLRSRMIKHASMNGHAHPEDIAQEYVVRLLEGHHQKATVSQAYIDILRKQTGRKGHKIYDAKRTLDSVVKTEAQLNSVLHQPNPDEGLSIDELIDLKNQLDQIQDSKLRKMFLLRLQGWTYEEIGIEFQYSQAYILLLIKQTIDDLNKKEAC